MQVGDSVSDLEAAVGAAVRCIDEVFLPQEFFHISLKLYVVELGLAKGISELSSCLGPATPKDHQASMI